jgi:outer membrane beta-barrel protein
LSRAQAEGGSDDLEIVEMELGKSAPKHETVRETPTYSEPSSKENVMSDFSGLGKLAPFKEVSVIQKRFMPKTERFQLFGGGTFITNDPFFNSIGGVLKGSYFFSETWGVELSYAFLSTEERQATKELKENNNVKSKSLIYPKSYWGADVVWVPIYGKMSLMNENIVPFDLYFSGGYGSTQTQLNTDASTLHVATGQIFSLSKAIAFRWDFSWNFYSAKTEDNSTNSFNNLFLTVGMSWFFPEAKYR